MLVENFISNQIARQFPEHFRENGKELVELVKAYYQFLESNEKQSIYESRKMFSYRDIDSTLDKFLVFFHKKFLAGLPYNEDTMRFSIKHILDLYRRKGSEEGIKIFFRMFFEENAEVIRPGKFVLRPSASKWNTPAYLELEGIPIDRVVLATGKYIRGSVSGAKAVVESVFFVMTNNTFRPVILLKDAFGNFERGDSLFEENGPVPATFYGRVFGSLGKQAEITIAASSTGFSVGEEVRVSFGQGLNARFLIKRIGALGMAEELKLLASGFGFAPNSSVVLASTTNPARVITLSIGNLDGQGMDAGRWDSKVSHIGVKAQRVIQDSNYYQDFSYEIQTSLLSDKYRDFVQEKLHVAGTKMFTRVCVEDTVDVGGDIRLGIDRL